MKDKVVYILGAGFSVDAGAPPQAKLVSELFRVGRGDVDNIHADAINKFRRFLEETLYINKTHFGDIPLEDIFSPLDKCINNNLSFRNLSLEEVLKSKSWTMVKNQIQEFRL